MRSRHRTSDSPARQGEVRRYLDLVLDGSGWTRTSAGQDWGGEGIGLYGHAVTSKGHQLLHAALRRAMLRHHMC